MSKEPLIATFHSEHSQYAALPTRIDNTLIDPLIRLRDALKVNIASLGKTVNAHAELATLLYNDEITDGRITVASQGFNIEKTQVVGLAQGRVKEIAGKLETQLKTMAYFQEIVEQLEEDVKEVLKRVTINGSPMA